MFALLVSAAATSLPAPRSVSVQAVATGRVISGQVASQAWAQKNMLHKREVRRVEADGRITRIQLIENE